MKVRRNISLLCDATYDHFRNNDHHVIYSSGPDEACLDTAA